MPESALDAASTLQPAQSCPLCGDVGAQTFFRKAGYDIVRCPSCRLVFLGNPPTDEELRRIHSFADNYHVGFRDDPEERRRFLQEAHTLHGFVEKLGPPGRVLDVGCSAGFFLHVAQKNGWQVDGIEFSPDTAALARERFGLNITQGTIHDAPFPGRTMDLLTIWDVIEHLRDPVAALHRAFRLLKPGGHIAISTPNEGGLYPVVSRWASALTGHWEHPEPPYHLLQFSSQTLAAALGRAGFELVKLHHRSQRLDHTFGSWSKNMRSPLRMLYTAAFMPLALIGPQIGAGDWIIAVGRRPVNS